MEARGRPGTAMEARGGSLGPRAPLRSAQPGTSAAPLRRPGARNVPRRQARGRVAPGTTRVR